MRIGTWNLDNRWQAAHVEFLAAVDCDVWLLTEVRSNVVIPGFTGHCTTSVMARGQRWAGVFSRSPLAPQLDPHEASACVVVRGMTFCSTILPWRGCGPVMWGEGSLGERTKRALDSLLPSLPRHGLVWGGDWNHSLFGDERAGSYAGRDHIEEALRMLSLQVPTRHLTYREETTGAIDHIAVPNGANVTQTVRIPAISHDRRLSDHDAYVVEIA